MKLLKQAFTGAMLITLVLFLQIDTASGEVGGWFIARGWNPGEYLCVGPDSTDGGGYSPQSRLYYTSDYGQHLETLYEEHWLIIRTDARENCCYGLYGTWIDSGYGRSWDGGRNWEELHPGILDNPPITTGRIPGEIYAVGRRDSIRYSDDYGNSYVCYVSENLIHLGLLVGHRDGEIYSTGYHLYRSEDYGRHFSIIYENQGPEDSIGFSNHNWLNRGVLEGELYLFDEAYFRLWRSTDHGRSWTLQCDMDYPDYARRRWYTWDMTTGVEEGEVVIYGVVPNYDIGIDEGGTIKFLVSHDYGRSFETFTPFDYIPGGIVEPEPAIPTVCSFETFPNPFNSQTNLVINLYTSQFITLRIFDSDGRFISQPAQGMFGTGSHRFLWPLTGSNLNLLSGCYFAVLNGQNGATISKLVITK